MSSNKTLVALTSEAHQLAMMIELLGGEITPELDEALQVNEQDLKDKADKYAFILKRIPMHQTYWKGIAEEANRVLKGLGDAETRLRDRIKATMAANGLNTIEGELNALKLSRARDSLVLDEPKLPAAYLMTKTEQVPDKERIRSDIERGEIISGAELRPSYTLKLKLKHKEIG